MGLSICDKDFQLTNLMFDIAAIIGKWIEIEELLPYDIRMTNVGTLPSVEWDFMSKMCISYGLELTRYKVRRQKSEGGRFVNNQGRSKKKSASQTRSNVLFDKYEIGSF